MGYCIDKSRMDEILEELSGEYDIYGPRLDNQKNRVRYRKISSVDQIINDRQSDFSPKEVYYPISQVMFYFKNDSVEISEDVKDKKALIFAHPCDINAIRSSDNIFLKNGGAEDLFYKRLRDKVRFVLLECSESYENCFCVSVGSNQTDDYSLAIRIRDDDVLVDVQDDELEEYFEDEDTADYEAAFIRENKKSVRIPNISRDNLKEVSEMPFWNQFDDKCVSCGGCNTVCGTCTCFDTVDVIYEEGSNDGERRRVWSGCMLEDFTLTAGGSRARKTPGANMRFKVFHKFYDYRDRFGGSHMCVGCGRCDIRCPQEISFYDTVCKLHDEIERL